MNNEINIEQILPPKVINGSHKRLRKNIAPMAAAIAAALFIALSAAVHIAVISVFSANVEKYGREFLLETVFSGFTYKDTPASEPTKFLTKAKLKIPETSDISRINYSAHDLSANAENGFEINGEVSFSADVENIAEMDKPIESSAILSEKYGDDAPLVLIYHTHGTEAYRECEGNDFRSNDINENVVAVGTALSEKLKDLGVPALHLCEMFDSEDWNKAYDLSHAAVKNALKEYPSLRYIIDMHRDSIQGAEGEFYKTDATYGSEECSQMMFVCGTDHGGSKHINWQDNLSVMLNLQSRLYKKSENLMRPVNLRSASFYQDISAGAMLIEIGTCGDRLDAAKKSALVFAEVLAEYIAE